MSKNTEMIDRYLAGQMTGDEKKNFEQQIGSDAELKAEVELQRQVMKGVQRHAMKQAAKKGFKKGSFRSKMVKWGAAVLIAAAATTLVWVAKDKLFVSEQNNIRYELNEENKKQWTDADKYLSPQIFEISGAKDTVIETSAGIVLAVPAGAFYDKYGAEVKDKIEIEIKEAMNPASIMQAGLSTTSNGRLLETGGMFYVNARRNGENLNIAQNKGLYVNVPADKVKEGMQLFEGKRLDNGQIDWVDPKPLETNIPTVDILSLNFYPPHFLDTARSFGYDIKNKKLTDSLYYSLECQYELDLAQYYPADSMRGASQSLTEKLKGMALMSSRNDTSFRTADAKTLFKANCAVCHTLTDEARTGPGLKGIKERVPGGDWLFNYIKNCEEMMRAGDPEAMKIYKEYAPSVMTVFEGTISDADIRALVDYITNPSDEIKTENTGSSMCEIAPSSIRAIWDPKYNETILATPQFEERLQVIFKTCNKGILDLYVNNLNAKFYELDEQAAKMCADKPECQKKFEEFAKRRDGGVSVKESHMRMLNKYFSEKQKMYSEAVLATLKKMYSKEAMEEKLAGEKVAAHDRADAERERKVFNEELEENMEDAYRQLGKPYVRPAKEVNRAPVAAVYYSATIISTGWKNVDAYVSEATVDRTSMEYIDEETGRKAIITYEPLSVKVRESSSYDRLYAYLLPNKLSSFQRMPAKTTDMFEEKLNGAFNYDLVVVGIRGSEMYMKEILNVRPGSQEIKLGVSSQIDINRLMSSRSLLGGEADLTRELRYLVDEQKEIARQEKIQKREEITFRLRKVALPCYVSQGPANGTSMKDIFDK